MEHHGEVQQNVLNCSYTMEVNGHQSGTEKYKKVHKTMRLGNDIIVMNFLLLKNLAGQTWTPFTFIRSKITVGHAPMLLNLKNQKVDKI